MDRLNNLRFATKDVSETNDKIRTIINLLEEFRTVQLDHPDSRRIRELVDEVISCSKRVLGFRITSQSGAISLRGYYMKIELFTELVIPHVCQDGFNADPFERDVVGIGAHATRLMSYMWSTQS